LQSSGLSPHNLFQISHFTKVQEEQCMHRYAEKLVIAALGLALGITSAVAQTTLPSAGQALPGLELFDQAVQTILTTNDYPGATMAVAFQGRLVLSKSYGFAKKGFSGNVPMAVGQRMRIASMSKWITAVAALKAAEQGKLDLDKPVAQVLGYSLNAKDYADPRAMNITTRQLLQNHAGWTIDRSTDPAFERVPPCPGRGERWLSAQKLTTDPGQLYSYSNINFCYAQLAIEKTTGQSYVDFVKMHVAAPAGITSWEFATLRGKADEPEYAPSPGSQGSPYANIDFESLGGAGAWTSSAEDYLRFVISVRGLRAPASPTLLSPELYKQLINRPAAAESAGKPVFYGLGVNVRVFDSGRHNLFHSGSLPGTSSMVMSFANGVSVVLIMNGRVASDKREASVNDTMRLLTEAAGKIKPPVGEIGAL
jgi:CubicO group peptidase (beta-lactamase class C family)